MMAGKAGRFAFRPLSFAPARQARVNPQPSVWLAVPALPSSARFAAHRLAWGGGQDLGHLTGENARGTSYSIISILTEPSTESVDTFTPD
jgi:hypothetical protein